jgi:DNA-3-methyladenine glycosylase
VRRAAPLPRSFYDRHVVDVARELLGAVIRRDDVAMRITEVEAYTWPGDTACHARSGRTQRNAALWGPHGRAYVYLCYGMHNMLNIVTGGEADAAAVLIRSCEPIAGHDTIASRRGDRRGPDALAGPGKVAAALALDRTWTDHPVYRTGGLSLEAGETPAAILVGPRIGIDYAAAAHRRLPWRFAIADTPWVTQRASLRRFRGA